MGIESAPYAAWLEEGLKALYEGGAEAICICGRVKSGEVVAGYFGCGPGDKAEFIYNIQTDLMMDLISANASRIKRLLEEAEDEEEDDV